MDIKEKIQEVIRILNEIDDYIDTIPNEQSNDDMALSDWYHYIENNRHSTKSAYRIVKHLKEHLKTRRHNKNQWELCRVYKTHINKLINRENREMLMNEIAKRDRELNKPYVYRIYDSDTLNEMVGNTNENNNQQYNLD